MKVYSGVSINQRSIVTVDGVPLALRQVDKLPATAQWGDMSDGAELLATSLLADNLDQNHAISLSTDFMEDVVSEFLDEWEITSEDIKKWAAYKCRVGVAAQRASMRPMQIGKPCVPISFPGNVPRILIDPNYRLRIEATAPEHGG